MLTPYIGVTGFMSRHEVDACLAVFPIRSKHLLMVGVLVSSKTLAGRKNKWPNRFPRIEYVPTIFTYKAAVNLIHYSTDESETLLDQLKQMATQVGPKLDGFQLNMVWPDPKVLREFKKANYLTKFVLQVGSRAMEKVNNSPHELADKVASEYRGLIDYVLLDPSGGLGIPMETGKMLEYLEALAETKLEIGPGVAGGLSPTTLSLVEPLIEKYPKLCIDAEGKLRDASDHLDLNLATEYLRKSLAFFKASNEKAYGLY